MRRTATSVPASVIGVLGGTLVVGVSLTLWAYWMLSDPTDHDKLWIEVGKSGLQVAVVGVLGAMVTLALKYLEEWRSKERQLNDYRQAILLELRTAYEDFKRVRRELRVDGFTTRNEHDPGNLAGERRGIYQAQMRKMNDAQLELEDVVTKLGTLPDGRVKTEQLNAAVNSMVHYADELVAEWERSAAVNQVGEFTRLMGFTGDPWPMRNDPTPDAAPPKEFGPGMTKPYRSVAIALQNDVLNNR